MNNAHHEGARSAVRENELRRYYRWQRRAGEGPEEQVKFLFSRKCAMLNTNQEPAAAAAARSIPGEMTVRCARIQTSRQNKKARIYTRMAVLTVARCARSANTENWRQACAGAARARAASIARNDDARQAQRNRNVRTTA